jgi:hypothetical protein
VLSSREEEFFFLKQMNPMIANMMQTMNRAAATPIIIIKFSELKISEESTITTFCNRKKNLVDFEKKIGFDWKDYVGDC